MICADVMLSISIKNSFYWIFLKRYLWANEFHFNISSSKMQNSRGIIIHHNNFILFLSYLGILQSQNSGKQNLNSILNLMLHYYR